MIHPFHPQLAIPDSFKECFTYEQQILYLVKWLEEMADAIGGPGSPAIDSLNEAVDQINKTLEELRQSLSLYVTIEAFDAYKDADADEKKAINDAINNLKGQLQDVIGSLDNYALKTDLQALSDSVDRIINDLGKTYATKSELKSAVDAINAELNTIKGNITGINTRLDGIDAEIEALRNSIPSLDDIKAVRFAYQGLPVKWQIDANGVGEGWLEDEGSNITNIIVGGPYTGNFDYIFPYSSGKVNTYDPIGRVYLNLSDGPYYRKQLQEGSPSQKYFNKNPYEENGTYINDYAAEKNGVPTGAGTFSRSAIETCAASVGFVINYLIYALTCSGCNGRSRDHKVLVDSTPTAESRRLVESGGVKEYVDQAIAGLTPGGGGGTITIDAVPTPNSTNAVSSNGVYNALQLKQNKLTFDSTPTTGSTNPVTSEGIKAYVDSHSGGSGITIDAKPTSGSSNAVSSGGVFDALQPIEQVAESAMTIAAEAKNESEDNVTAIAALRTDVNNAAEAAAEADRKAQEALDNAGSGAPGAAAGFGDVTATVDDTTGTPSVTVSASGPDTAKNFAFEFHNLKGAAGEPGAPGADGDSAGFGNVTATVDDTTGTPSVNVEVSGPNTAKNISFAFHGLKGEPGEGGGSSDTALTHTMGTANRIYEIDKDGKLLRTRCLNDVILIPHTYGDEMGYILSINNKLVKITGNFGDGDYEQFVKAYAGESDNKVTMLCMKKYVQGFYDFITYVADITDVNSVTLTAKSYSSINNEFMKYMGVVSAGTKELPIFVSNMAFYVANNSKEAGTRVGLKYFGQRNTEFAASNGTTLLTYDGAFKLWGFNAVPDTETVSGVSNVYDNMTLNQLDSMETDASVEWLGHDGKQWIVIVGGNIYKIDDKITALGDKMDVLYTMAGSMDSGGDIQKPNAMCGDGFVSVKINLRWHTYHAGQDYSDSDNTRYTQQSNSIIAITDYSKVGIVPAVGLEPISWYDLPTTNIPVTSDTGDSDDGPGLM